MKGSQKQNYDHSILVFQSCIIQFKTQKKHLIPQLKLVKGNIL